MSSLNDYRGYPGLRLSMLSISISPTFNLHTPGIVYSPHLSTLQNKHNNSYKIDCFHLEALATCKGA